ASLALRQQIQHFLEHLDTLRYARDTQSNYRSALMEFARWCDGRGLSSAQQVSFAHLESWQRSLSAKKNRQGYPILACTIVKKLGHVRHLFGWLVKRQYLLYNPALSLERPRTEKRLPGHILSEQEIQRILSLTLDESPMGVRDRAMMETLWSSGIRRSEAQRLQVGDVDFSHGVIFIRQGKGRKDRMVPLGQSAMDWLQRYLNDVRPRLVWGKDPGHLFLSRRGKVMSGSSMTLLVRDALHRAGIEKPGACHLFRHSMATQMLENGADTRHIQAILGHASLDSTQIYTHVAIGHLKKVHEKTHPAERAASGKSDNAPLNVDTEPPESHAGHGVADGTASDPHAGQGGQPPRPR
ncbi:site-specific tyrosine recombinase XerC, partial [Xenorhabdus szentirmaii]